MQSCVFLDRDGVINHDYGYVYKEKDFIIIEGVLEALKIINKKGYKIIIITNQSGIAKKIFTIEDYDKLNRYMLNIFSANQIDIESVLHCPHDPKINGYCNCRKPNPGMILTAKNEYFINLEKSFLIGDKITDVEAGISAGIKNSFLISSNKNKDILSFFNLLEFSNWIPQL